MFCDTLTEIRMAGVACSFDKSLCKWKNDDLHNLRAPWRLSIGSQLCLVANNHAQLARIYTPYLSPQTGICVKFKYKFTDGASLRKPESFKLSLLLKNHG